MIRFARLSRRRSTVVGVVAALYAVPVLAQEAPPPQSAQQLDDIIVTARKRAESLQNVPAAISAIDSNQLRATHVSRVDDLNSLVPNLNITVRADNTPDVTIRGIGAFGVTEGVGFYANDVQLFEGQTVRTEDLERIEVLKGPQGTLYGGNNIGGAIKFITKKPTDVLSAEGSVEIGDRNTRNFSAAVSGPLVGDVLKARISAYSAVNDGFVYDPTLDRTLGHSNQRGGRLTLAYDAANTNATFSLYGSQDRSTSQNLYYAAANDHSYSRETTANVPPTYRRDLYAPSLQLDQQIAGLGKLTSITSYFHSEIKARSDGDHRAAPFFDVSQSFRKNIWSEELRLASVGDGPLTWLIGGFIQQRRSRDNEANTQMLSIITGDPADDGVILSASKRLQREYSGFANVNYKFGAITLEGGVRVERFDNRLTDTIGLVTKDVSGTEVLPKASISYKIDKDNMLYATISRGLQPGDALESHNFVSVFKSEKTTNYEIGAKTLNFNRILLFNLSAFYIQYENRLFSTIDGATLEEVTKNVGPSHNYGAEADFMVRATREFTLSGGFGFTRAVWENIPGYFNPNTGMTINLKGLTAPFAPAYQANLAAEWKHQFSSDVEFDFRIDGSFHGKQYWNISDDYKQRPYQLMNIGGQLTLGKRYTLAATVKNVFDTQYHTIFAGGPDIGSPTNTTGFSLPRQWFLSLRFKY